MKLLYANEHFSCFNYSSGENTLIKLLNLKKNETTDICPEGNCIIFVISGELTFSYGAHVNIFAKTMNAIVHPANLNCRITTNSETDLLIMQLNVNMSFCDHFSFEMLMQENLGKGHSGVKSLNIHIMEANKSVEHYLLGLVDCFTDGLRCTYLLEMKIKELLFLFRAYYSKDELRAFFSPILNNDLMFSLKVHSCYNNNSSITVNQLAHLMNYSLSGFEKKFRKVFAMSAYQWIQNKMAQSIYHDINCGTKTFSELAYEYNFSSPAHFNTFCKRKFNASPGSIRKINAQKKNNQAK